MIRFFTLATLLTSSALAENPSTERESANIRTAPPEEILSIDNDTAKIGIDKSKGAAITWLSWKEYPQNTVNIHDPGRLIQQSYYAGKRLDRSAEGQTSAWTPWSWNPIQGGGTHSWAQVSIFEKSHDGDMLHAETIPKLWDMPDEDAEAIMKQWTAFEPDMPDVIVVRNSITANRKPGDPWGPAVNSPQEVHLRVISPETSTTSRCISAKESGKPSPNSPVHHGDTRNRR